MVFASAAESRSAQQRVRALVVRSGRWKTSSVAGSDHGAALKQRILRPRTAGLVAEVVVGRFAGDAATRRALQEPDLDQIRLVEVFDGAAVLADRRRQRVEAGGAAVKALDDGGQQLAIDFVEAVVVDFEHLQSLSGDLRIHLAFVPHFGVVAHATQQAVGDSRRSTRAARDLVGGFGTDRNTENVGGAADDDGQRLDVVKIQTMDNPEPRAQRRCEQAGPRGGADEGKWLELISNAPRAGALTDDDVHEKIFHRRVEDFFHRRRKAVDLIDEKDLVWLEIRKDTNDIARFLQRRPGGGADGGLHLVGQDVRQRGFAEARRAEEQNVIERLLAIARRSDGDLQVRFDFLLTDVLLETFRSKREFGLDLVFERLRRKYASVGHSLHCTGCQLPVTSCRSERCRAGNRQPGTGNRRGAA